MWITGLLLVATGCAMAHEGEPEPAGGPVTEPATRPDVTPIEPRSCELELGWADPVRGFSYGAHVIQISPNGALAANTSVYGGQVVRTGDGAIFAGVVALEGMDRSWRLVPRVAEDGMLEVLDGSTGELLAQSSAPTPPASDPSFYRTSIASLSPDGTMAFALDCWEGSDGRAAAVLRTVPVSAHAVPREIPLGVGCTAQWVSRHFVLPSTDGSDVIVGGLEGRYLARVDARSGEIRFPALPVGEPSEAARRLGGGDRLVAIDRAPDGGPVAAVTPDGRLHLLDGSTLTPLDAPIPVGVAVGNSNTYMPTVDSPVAIDVATDRLAAVGEDGRVMLLALSTGEEIGRLDAPFEPTEEPWAPQPNLPMGLRFGDGFLLVSYEGGMARYGCERPAAAPARDELVVHAELASGATTASPFTVRVWVEGSDQPVLRWIENGDAPMSSIVLGPELTSWAPAGTHTVRVVAHDGERTGSTELTFTVVESP